MENMGKTKFREIYDALPPKTSVAPKSEFVREMASLCKVHTSTVRCWLAGTQRPDALRTSILAKCLGVPEDVLFS